MTLAGLAVFAYAVGILSGVIAAYSKRIYLAVIVVAAVAFIVTYPMAEPSEIPTLVEWIVMIVGANFGAFCGMALSDSVFGGRP